MSKDIVRQGDLLNHTLFCFHCRSYHWSCHHYQPPLLAFFQLLMGRKRVVLRDCDPLFFSPSNWSTGGPYALIHIKGFGKYEFGFIVMRNHVWIAPSNNTRFSRSFLKSCKLCTVILALRNVTLCQIPHKTALISCMSMLLNTYLGNFGM